LYWLKQGKDISDGLQYFKIEKDVLDMTSAAVEERKVRVLVDHTIFLCNLRPDMIRRSDVEIISTTTMLSGARTSATGGQGQWSGTNSDSEIVVGLALEMMWC
jgi:hypothetical protein